MDVDDEYDLDHNVILLKNPGVQAEPRTPPPQTLRPDAESGLRETWVGGSLRLPTADIEDEMGGLADGDAPAGRLYGPMGRRYLRPGGGRTPCAPTP